MAFETLADTVASAPPGTRVVLEDGTYTSPLRLEAAGSAESPVVVVTETPGGVRFSGSGRLEMTGQYLVVSGFLFIEGMLDPLTPHYHVVRIVDCTGCRLTDSKVQHYDAPWGLNLQWVWIDGGGQNRVDHCEFSRKDSFGEMLRVTRRGQGHDRIDHNYFHDFARDVLLNGGEAIRIGTGGQRALRQMHTTIENNLFERIRAETEIISVKASGVTIRGNTFRDCFFLVNLRVADDCVVAENVFLGGHNGVAGGIAVYGNGHQVLNNHFLGTLTGIRLGAGHPGGFDGCENGYRAAHSAVVRGNRFTNVSESISVDHLYGLLRPRSCPVITQRATGQRIEDNDGPADASLALDASHPCMGPTRARIVFGGSYQ